ncbi:hypothetical protein [Microtetraspora fusca]|uniref:hypothetical protein n=1 Tax=Microtetraspora fusca TaxID=1997 RepID=UPI0012FAC8A2|nr:hypothetical protein [Microtetraspora fusca]
MPDGAGAEPAGSPDLTEPEEPAHPAGPAEGGGPADSAGDAGAEPKDAKCPVDGGSWEAPKWPPDGVAAQRCRAGGSGSGASPGVPSPGAAGCGGHSPVMRPITPVGASSEGSCGSPGFAPGT